MENDSFKIETKVEPGCRVTHRIEVKSEQAKKAHKRAVKKVNKEISIPGFRKGRAPDDTVISRYGSYVDREWKDLLVNDAYRAALELTNIYPFNKESIEKPKIERCSLEEGALVLISYERTPELPTIDFSELKIPPIERAPVQEGRVEEILEDLRRSFATFEPVEGRAVQEGDYVDVTIDSLDEDPPKNIVKDRRFEVSDKRMAPWLTRLLVGMPVGGTADGTSEVDANADDQVKARFKPTHVRITLHAILTSHLPEIDDELAKKAGAASKEDLTAKVRANLEKEAEEQQKHKQISALEMALLEAYPFELPASLVATEKREALKRAIQELKDQQLNDEAIQERRTEIEQRVSREVETALHLYFIEKQIVRQGDLSLTNEELSHEYTRQIVQNPQYFGRNMDKDTSRELISRLASDMLRRKAQEYALAKTLAASSPSSGSGV